MPGSTRDPAVPGGQAAFRDDGGRPVRRHRDQQVERLLAAVGEHDAPGLDALGLGTDALRDPALGELPGHPLGAGPAGVRHQHRLQRHDSELGAVAQAAGAAGARGGGTRTRRGPAGTGTARRRSGSTMRPPVESPRAPAAAAGTPAKPQTSCPCSASPGTRSGRETAPSAITSWSPSSAAVGRLGRPRGRVDREDLLLDDADSVTLEQRALDRLPSAIVPWPTSSHSLRSPIVNCRLAVDEHDLVVVAEQPLQLDRRRRCRRSRLRGSACVRS